MIRITEDPASLNYQTNYTHDALSNLLTVAQGSQFRMFVYDSLLRLSSATMPEYSTPGGTPGTIAYQYDGNSNLTKRTDPRGVITDYTYDKLNRPVTRIYSTQSGDPIAIAAATASPPVNFHYDDQALPGGGPAGFSRGIARGRLVAVTYGGGGSLTGSFYGYDIAGRIVNSLQLTASDAAGQYAYPLGYEHFVGGGLKKETYPSGRMIEHTYDDAGRMNLVNGTAGGSVTTYAQAFQYTPHGAVAQYQQGNLLWAHTKFNSRLQVERIGLGTSNSIETTAAVSALRLAYTYGTTANNGNVQTQEITINATTTPTVINQEYSYDNVNRLAWYKENGVMAQSYGYDSFGNRWITSSPVPGLIPVSQSHYNAATNRIQMGGYPYSYDHAGNIVVMPQIPEAPTNRTLNYDGENRIVSTKLGPSGAQDYYYYDGEGRRIRKKVLGAETVFIYDAAGKLVAEYSPTAPPPNPGGTRYITADNIESTRVLSDGAGNVLARYDYRPFGEDLGVGIGGRTSQMGYSTSETFRQRFTQKERDNESGLDYFLARYYSSAQGRFASPDKPLIGQDEEDPQTWNLYLYTSNNPLNRVDPNGERWFYKQDENGRTTDAQWVNPNDDGTYTSPGEGWIEFIPTESRPSLWLYTDNGNIVTLLGEYADGSPISKTLSAGRIEDASWDIVGLFVPGRLGLKGVLTGASALWTQHLARKAAKEAFEEALSGGRHAGWLKVYMNLSKQEIEKGIRSIQKLIAEHEAKIASPGKHIKGWDKLDPRHQADLVNKRWPSDVARQKEQLGILKELNKRK